MEAAATSKESHCHGAWWTGDELKFLDMLAERQDPTAFRGYVDSIFKRQRWGSIDRKKLMTAVSRHLKNKR